MLHEYTGEEIRQLRYCQHLRQTVFAKYLNVSPAMIRSLEQGKRSYSPLTTLSMFLTQALSPDRSCQNIVNMVAIEKINEGLLPTNTL